MKAPVQATRRTPPRTKNRNRGHSALYRAHKEVSPAGMRIPDFLASQLCFPKPVLLRLVSFEASRLSKTNRRKVITLQEIRAAVRLVRQRVHTSSAA